MIIMEEERLYLLCDGSECEAKTCMPVALHSQLSSSADPSAMAQGWLFVVNNERRKHYCPECAQKHLQELLSFRLA